VDQEEVCLLLLPYLLLVCPALDPPQDLTSKKWTKKKWNGPLQYEDKTGTLMMLPTDMALVWDRKFKK
jgi:hypothetical protein